MLATILNWVSVMRRKDDDFAGRAMQKLPPQGILIPDAKVNAYDDLDAMERVKLQKANLFNGREPLMRREFSRDAFLGAVCLVHLGLCRIEDTNRI